MEEMEIEEVFESQTIDLEYEFDAARWFDFTREESAAEARQAEIWFETAGSYPPSPFVTKLILKEDVCNDSSCSSLKPKDGETTTELCEDTGIFTDVQNRNILDILNQRLGSTKGLTFSSHMFTDKIKGKPKSTKKSVLPRSSTLMKPTASQLAKQNHSRFEMFPFRNNEKSLCNSAVDSQAAKRQKLEGGQLLKVANTTQQINLVHKTPKKERTIDPSFTRLRTKLTVPREPELVTAYRAQRTRPEADMKLELEPSAVYRFKARPLNRKILEAPSWPLPKKSTPRLPEFQEFHLKTCERALQHSSAATSSSHQCTNSDKGLARSSTGAVADSGNREARRPSVMDASKQSGPDVKCNFKALPLDRRILSSKGDIGVFRNTKRETTVPKEFKFYTGERVQPILPIDLFGKLSITSEMQPTNRSELKSLQPNCISTKASKENRLNAPQVENKMMHMEKGKDLLFCENQNKHMDNSRNPDIGEQWTSRRSLGIR